MTEDFTAKITLYHNLFLVCFVLFLVCLGAAAVLFFLLDIADVAAYLTGRKARKQIQKLEQDSAKNGMLQMAETPAALQAEKHKKRHGKTKPAEAFTGTEKLEQVFPADGATEKLYGTAGETAGIFEIEQELLLVHTEERI